MKVVSIITVVFNGVNEIEGTILSALNQTYAEKEYIIIDGGSTDGTVEVIKKYLDRITVFISEADKGIYDAMNKGVSLSNGSWINFMNCGDSFYNNNVLEEVFKTGRLNSDVIYGSVCCFDRYNRVVIQPQPLSSLKKRMAFCHQSSFVKRDLLLKYPFDTLFKICADYKLFYSLYRNGYSFERTSKCIANYEIENGLSSKNAFLSEKENSIINQTWGKPLAMSNLMGKMIKFYSMKFFKSILPYSLVKYLKDHKYHINK